MSFRSELCSVIAAEHRSSVTHRLRRRRTCELLLWVALVAQVLLAVRVNRPWMTADSPTYLTLAAGIRAGHYGTVVHGFFYPDILRPPGYPLLLAGLTYVSGPQLAVIVYIQGFLYLISLRLFQIAAIQHGLNDLPFLALAVIYPFGALYDTQIMTEAWGTIALSAISVLICSENLSPSKLIGAGVLSGSAVLLRSDFLLLPAVLAAIVLARSLRRGAGKSMGAAGLVLAVSALTLSPYIAWNFAHFRRASPTPSAAADGNTLYLATWQEALSPEDLELLYKGQVTPAVRNSGFMTEVATLNASIGAPRDIVPFNPAAYPTQQTQIASTHVYRAAAFRRIRAEPLLYLKHVFKNTWALWNTSRYPAEVPPGAVLVLRLVAGLLFASAVFGIAAAVTDNCFAWAWPAIALFLYLPAVHAWFHTEARYTAAARPLLLMFASFAVLKLHRLSTHSKEAT